VSGRILMADDVETPTSIENAAPSPVLTSPESFDDIIKVVDGYRGNATLLSRAHNIAAEQSEKKNTYLGVPAAIIAAVVGSSIFASLSSDQKNIYLIIITGSLSILAAVLSSLQTFLRYPEIAQSHKSAKDGYESVRRRIDIFKIGIATLPPPSRAKTQIELQTIAEQMDELGKTSPIVSIKILRNASNDALEINSLLELVAPLVASFIRLR
jgi:hypothetical protein